ncbi:hypothetical protein OROMI_014830 [Orobanche minor]
MDRFVVDLDGDGDGDGDIYARNAKSGNEKESIKQVKLDIGRCFFENGIPFNVVSTPSFINMCRSLGNFGRDSKPPTTYELSAWILDEETGVSILSDGWKDIRGRELINFIVNNPHGSVFLKSIDASDAVKDAKILCELLDKVVMEVGEDIIIQVVTNNAANYKAAGELLMAKRPRLWWTRCVVHCIDVMLEKIGDLSQHKIALTNQRRYNHGWVLALMRKYANRELVRLAATRFATAYLTLEIGKMPGMGFLYGVMNKAKEDIARKLGGGEGCDDDFSTHPEVKVGLLTRMAKLYPDPRVQEKNDLQMDAFRRRKGLFGFETAKRTCKKCSLVDWWLQYGDGTPELQGFVVRILSLTCSSSACERNYSTFNQLRWLKKASLKEDDDPLLLDHLPSGDESIVDKDSASGSWAEDGDFGRVNGSQITRGRGRGPGRVCGHKRKIVALEKGKGLQLFDEEFDEEDYGEEEDLLHTNDLIRSDNDDDDGNASVRILDH